MPALLSWGCGNALYLSSHSIKSAEARKNITFLLKLIRNVWLASTETRKGYLLHSEAFTIVPTYKSFSVLFVPALHH